MTVQSKSDIGNSFKRARLSDREGVWIAWIVIIDAATIHAMAPSNPRPNSTAVIRKKTSVFIKVRKRRYGKPFEGRDDKVAMPQRLVAGRSLRTNNSVKSTFLDVRRVARLMARCVARPNKTNLELSIYGNGHI